MHLTWNGHSCFTLETRQGTLVLDPYRPGSVPGLPNLKLEADGVYCSHQHDDHAGAELVTLSGARIPSVSLPPRACGWPIWATWAVS